MGLPVEEAHPTETGNIIFIPDSDQFMSDSNGHSHGTKVASLATGVTVGSAKKAHLVPIKWRNRKGQVTPTAVESSFRYVIDRVIKTNLGLYMVNGALLPIPARNGKYYS